jgi:hypothetical protein
MEADDKLLLALSKPAVEHLLEFVGRPCPMFNVGTGCPLCAEITGDARSAIDTARESDEGA